MNQIYKPKSKHFHSIHQRWSKRKDEITANLIDEHKDSLNKLNKGLLGLAVGSIGTLMVASHNPVMAQEATVTPINTDYPYLDENIFLVHDLKKLIPEEVRPLKQDEEKNLENFLSDRFSMRIRATLNSIKLERNYGYIGQEQHLARFPGDSLDGHFQTPTEAESYSKYGMAPGLGAFRYFSDSQSSLTQEEIDKEKYYIAIQTFLSEHYYEDTRRHVEFFKFRKILLVNPDNGKSIVAVIGDAGPAQWTGKHLGGSPEVMNYLKRVDGRGKGAVLYFFIDDEENQIPLGPIKI